MPSSLLHPCSCDAWLHHACCMHSDEQGCTWELHARTGCVHASLAGPHDARSLAPSRLHQAFIQSCTFTYANVCVWASSSCVQTHACRGISPNPNLHGFSAPSEATYDFCKLQICSLLSPFALARGLQRGRWCGKQSPWAGLPLDAEGQCAFILTLAKALVLGRGVKRPLWTCGIPDVLHLCGLSLTLRGRPRKSAEGSRGRTAPLLQ